MISLLAAAGFFLLIHLMVAGTQVRDGLVRRMGEGPYAGVFSLVSVAGLVWLGWAFAQGRSEAWNQTYWDITPATHHVQLGLQVLAMLFIVPGLLTANPTSVAQSGALDRADVIKGMLRITRHPFLWGVAIWATGHLLVNGDRASIVLFGTMLILAVFGTASIDAKRKRALGDKWTAFAQATSNIPFGAILSGRQSLRLGEIGLWKLALAVAVYVALVMGHAHAFGVSALG